MSTRRIAAIAVIFTSLLAVAGVVVAVYTFGLAKERYRSESLRRLTPPGLALLGAPESAAARTETDVLLLGDSRIAGLEFPTELPCLTEGYPGATTGELLLHSAVIERRLVPKLVVVQAGINDLKAIGVGAPVEETIGRVVENLIALAERWQRAAGAEVIVCAVLPTTSPSLKRRPVWSGDIPAAVSVTNTKLREAAGASFSFLPLDAFLDSGTGLAERTLYRDTLHLNPAGNTLFAEAIKRSKAYAALIEAP